MCPTFLGEKLVDEHAKTVLRMVAHRLEVVMNRPFAAFGEQAFAYRDYLAGPSGRLRPEGYPLCRVVLADKSHNTPRKVSLYMRYPICYNFL